MVHDAEVTLSVGMLEGIGGLGSGLHQLRDSTNGQLKQRLFIGAAYILQPLSRHARSPVDRFR